MYNVGMYGGCFNPLHLGHINCIIQAANQCKKLYVVLSHSDSDIEIPYQIRFRWLKQATKDMDNVEVVAIKDNSKSKDEYDWRQGSEDIKNTIKELINVVFCGSDYNTTDNPFHICYPNASIVYIDRGVVNISSTKIRNSPYKYWDYLPKEVRPYFVKKVLVIGTESCGKSSLVRNLAKYYNTSYVEEKGRNICEFAGGIDNMIPYDFVEILHTHKLSEIEETRKANKLLFVDTDCIVTDYYLKLQFENTNTNITNVSELAYSMSKLNKYDLVIFLEPDVEWVQDGTRTYGEDEVRTKNNDKLKDMLKSYEIKYHSVKGNYQDRFLDSVKLINSLLNVSR